MPGQLPPEQGHSHRQTGKETMTPGGPPTLCTAAGSPWGRSVKEGVSTGPAQVAPAACHPYWEALGWRTPALDTRRGEGHSGRQRSWQGPGLRARGDKAAPSGLSMGASVLGWGRGASRPPTLLPAAAAEDVLLDAGQRRSCVRGGPCV